MSFIQQQAPKIIRNLDVLKKQSIGNEINLEFHELV